LLVLPSKYFFLTSLSCYLRHATAVLLSRSIYRQSAISKLYLEHTV